MALHLVMEKALPKGFDSEDLLLAALSGLEKALKKDCSLEFEW